MKNHRTTTITLALLCSAIVTLSPARAEEGKGKPIAQGKVPAAALAAMKKYAGEGTIEKILVEKHGKTTVYEAVIKGPGKAEREVAVTEDGVIQSEEVVVALADVPEKVRAAMENHAKGAKITEVIRITEDGATLYEAEFENDGKKSEVKFTEAGEVKPVEVEDDKK